MRFKNNSFFNFFNLLDRLINLKKKKKIIILLTIDFLIFFISIYSVNFFSGINTNFLINQLNIFQKILLGFCCLSIYIFSGQYNSLSRYIRSSEIYSIAQRNLTFIPIMIIFEIFLNSQISDLSIYLLFWIINTFIVVFSRFTLKEVLNFYQLSKYQNISKVAIYGAGAAGAQLASALILAGNHRIEAFFDDSKNLQGRKLLGIKILNPNKIEKYKGQIKQILFAIPSLEKEKAIRIIKKVQGYKIPILKVPSIEALTSGNAKIDSLRPIEIEDLLGRRTIKPNQELLSSSIKNKNICITGAGGSIGRELCNQVLKNSPKKLVMIDSSEANLYNLEQDLIQNKIKNDISLDFILGNVKDYSFVKSIFKKYSINVVFHAAAYKHVPLIERNALQGIENNILSTFSICKAAEEENLSKVTLISTDKAVRPSNVMGATKRFAELILQSFAEKISNQNSDLNDKQKINKLKFSIVRFGNVLGSSGSVVPLFKKQIASGGPITLTDERVIRYFMTISEAAQLVIQATSLSKGGDVFILDMGEPVLIKELAEQMIRLSGLKVKTKNEKDGDIEIVNIGLRPGEKLYEELLIDGKRTRTKHPLIFKANEFKIPYKELMDGIDSLKVAISNLDEKQATNLLYKFVPEWKKMRY